MLGLTEPRRHPIWLFPSSNARNTFSKGILHVLGGPSGSRRVYRYEVKDIERAPEIGEFSVLAYADRAKYVGIAGGKPTYVRGALTPIRFAKIISVEKSGSVWLIELELERYLAECEIEVVLSEVPTSPHAGKFARLLRKGLPRLSPHDLQEARDEPSRFETIAKHLEIIEPFNNPKFVFLKERSILTAASRRKVRTLRPGQSYIISFKVFRSGPLPETLNRDSRPYIKLAHFPDSISRSSPETVYIHTEYGSVDFTIAVSHALSARTVATLLFEVGNDPAFSDREVNVKIPILPYPWLSVLEVVGLTGAASVPALLVLHRTNNLDIAGFLIVCLAAAGAGIAAIIRRRLG